MNEEFGDASDIPLLATRQRLRKEVEKIYRDSVKLSSQALRVCQQLYTEGLTVLYSENILCVYHSNTWEFYVFNYGVETVCNATSIPRVSLSLSDLLACDVGQRYNGKKAKLYIVCPSLGRFDHINVTIDGVLQHFTGEPLAVACRVLGCLLKGKNVSLFFTDREKQIFARDVPKLQPHSHYLRCKSFKFQGPLNAEVIETVRTLMSDDPLQDTVESYRGLIDQCGPFKSNPNGAFCYQQIVSHLRPHAFDYNFEKFEKAVKGTLRKLKADNIRYCRRIVAEAEAERVRREEQLERVLGLQRITTSQKS